MYYIVVYLYHTNEQKPKEVKKEQELLKQILNKEAQVAKIGAEAGTLKRKFAKLFSPIKSGDKVVYKMWPATEREKEERGVVTSVRFDTTEWFSYYVTPYTKQWKPAERRNGVRITTGGEYKGSIKKYESNK